MQVSEAPPADVRPLMGRERGDLLELLKPLTASEWTHSTAVPGWRVKDIALHLLDDDLGWLSRDRDHDPSGLLDRSGDQRTFVRALAEKNQRWIEGASGMSQRVVTELLEWSGRSVDQFLAAADLTAPALVSWASDEAVPAWLDIARDFTERWVHHQQIRDALGQPGGHLEPYLEAVLETFVWAFPHQYRIDAKPGTQVEVRLGKDRIWHLTRRADYWDLDLGGCDSPAAQVEMTQDTAWRMLTGGPYEEDGVIRLGRPDLIQAILAVRSIII